MSAGAGLRLLHRHLEPGESLAEVLFGLIMTLTFTLGAGLVISDRPDAVRELLLATIGCNLAWGLIDGALYVTGQVFERGRLRRLAERIRAAADEAAAAQLVAAELDEFLGRALGPQEHDEVTLRMARNIRAAPLPEVGLRFADLKGAVASAALVFAASFPAAVPFMLVDDAGTALRTSNAVLIALLFAVGWRWARETSLSPWRTGLALTAGGLAMVALSIALGG